MGRNLTEWHRDDITFCSCSCDNRACYRNPIYIADHTIPHSFADFSKTEACPRFISRTMSVSRKGEFWKSSGARAEVYSDGKHIRIVMSDEELEFNKDDFMKALGGDEIYQYDDGK